MRVLTATVELLERFSAALEWDGPEWDDPLTPSSDLVAGPAPTPAVPGIGSA